MPTVCWLLAGLPPVLVVLAAAGLVLFNWWRYRDVRGYMALHQRILDNLRKAVDAYGKDGSAQAAEGLWAGDGRATLEYVAQIFSQATRWEDRARELATLNRSEEWYRFWQDLEAVTEYAWRVSLRRALETWAHRVMTFCPRSIAVPTETAPASFLPEHLQHQLASALCEVYAAIQEPTGETDAEEIRARIAQVLASMVNLAGQDASMGRAVRIWHRLAADSLERLLRPDGEVATNGIRVS